MVAAHQAPLTPDSPGKNTRVVTGIVQKEGIHVYKAECYSMAETNIIFRKQQYSNKIKTAKLERMENCEAKLLRNGSSQGLLEEAELKVHII